MDPTWFLIDDEGHYIQNHTIIGTGDGVVVIERDDVAIKMAIVHTRDTLAEVEEHRRKIRREQSIWRRVQPDPETPVQGIVHCVRLSGDTIEMKYMSGGSLSKWLRHRARPSISLQKRWIRQLAIGLHNLHERRVIHGDVLARNILLDESSNVVLADLGASSIMPLDTVMTDAVDKYNCSIWTDLCQLGLVIHEIVTGRRHSLSLYDSDRNGGSIAKFPSRDRLPSLGRNLWARDIIEACWTERGYGAAGAAGIVKKLDGMRCHL
jgi:serine/threonine protein kinase